MEQLGELMNGNYNTYVLENLPSFLFVLYYLSKTHHYYRLYNHLSLYYLLNIIQY